MKTLQARIVRLESESNHYRKLLEEAQMLRCDIQLESQNALCLNSNTNVNQKPEDVIRMFMMKEFVGRHVLGHLIVPGVGHGKNQK
ncbi:hypothetical protein LOK49_LG06G00674 [Camellia lanceoleosa]|uniref:Uncharacterized protein n=1 Tax=Camellia lanceoleosa TaxID=1840588 RepID=A0ACC0HFP7_9ERIC|nr:hypothetical protein LOK49_LG06G00674 [Camellia lanceoleosa]